MCTPYMYFSRYVPESIFKVIAENTNLYSVQSTLHNVNTTADEMRKLFGMHILHGCRSFAPGKTLLAPDDEGPSDQ